MEPAKLVGIGFMGKSERAARLLKKIMASTHYAPDLSTPEHSHPAGLSDGRPLTGFYLGFTDGGLNLSLFSKDGDPDSRKMNSGITYSMKKGWRMTCRI